MPRKKLSKLSDTDEKELQKLSKKERIQAVTGEPDDSDVRNLTELFTLYEKSHPGLLARMKQDHDTQVALGENISKPRGYQSKLLSPAFWMPQDLQEFVEEYFPTLWQNKAHAEWFVRKFPLFKS